MHHAHHGHHVHSMHHTHTMDTLTTDTTRTTRTTNSNYNSLSSLQLKHSTVYVPASRMVGATPPIFNTVKEFITTFHWSSKTITCSPVLLYNLSLGNSHTGICVLQSLLLTMQKKVSHEVTISSDMRIDKVYKQVQIHTVSYEHLNTDLLSYPSQNFYWLQAAVQYLQEFDIQPN